MAYINKQLSGLAAEVQTLTEEEIKKEFDMFVKEFTAGWDDILLNNGITPCKITKEDYFARLTYGKFKGLMLDAWKKFPDGSKESGLGQWIIDDIKLMCTSNSAPICIAIAEQFKVKNIAISSAVGVLVFAGIAYLVSKKDRKVHNAELWAGISLGLSTLTYGSLYLLDNADCKIKQP
jgi:hypothetical protein